MNRFEEPDTFYFLVGQVAVRMTWLVGFMADVH